MSNQPLNGWTKYIGVVLFYLALQAAILGPIIAKQQDLEVQLNKHENLPHHYGTAEKLSAIEVKFTEVETQFKWYREMTQINDAVQQKEIDDLKKQIEFLQTKK